MRELYHAVLFDLYGTLIDETAAATPGALERVAECAGAKWGIVTSAGQSLAHRLLAHARIPVPNVLITGDDVAQNKPAPDGYLLAASRLKVEAGETLAIEDTAGGIAAARAAGMDVVAVRYGRSADFCRAATFAIGDLTKLRLRKAEGAVEVTSIER
jgi:sugar-phosphatase